MNDHTQTGTAQATHPRNTPIRVMIVEDEKVVALHLRHQLAEFGHQVVAVASSGADALRRIEAERPDVVLMDIKIDGELDGIETARRIPGHLNIPVIYLTAYSEENTLRRASTTAPYGYLLKPFSERELNATLTMAIRRREVERALRASEERLGLALDAADMGCWEMDGDSGRVVGIRRAEEILGVAGQTLDDSWETFLGLVAEEDRAMVDLRLGRAVFENGEGGVEFRRHRPDGELRWLRAQAKTHAADPATTTPTRRAVGVVRDITDEKRAHTGLRNAAAVFHNSHDGIVILNDDLKIIDANPAYIEMIGEPLDTLLGTEPSFTHDYRRSPQSDPATAGTLGPRARWTRERNMVHPDGARAVTRVTVTAVPNGGHGQHHHVAIISDITEMRRVEDELRRLAHIDSLTGLPNRLVAMDRLAGAISRAQRRGERLAVLFVDLDNFKQVNDTLGHACGDELLASVARRMNGVIRDEDTVARLGGDEFMILMEQLNSIDAAAHVAERVTAAITPPMTVCGETLSVTASIGIAVFPGDGMDGPALIKAADTAMYAAKEAGRNRYAFYATRMTHETVMRMTQEHELRAAAERGQLTLHYQPIFALSDGRVTGVEALVRWNHPERGLVAAGDIIPVAERSDLILDIGDWVLRTACAQAAEWRRRGLFANGRLAVNTSIRQLRNHDLVARVTETLNATGLSPDALELEITESMLQGDPETTATLTALRGVGVHLSIDDFGTGYSCLSSLKTLPIQRLKVDRSFVRDIPQGPKDTALTEAIIAMAHRLGLTVTAEGIETEAQRDYLRKLGCADGQGYLLARPMPAEAAEALLA